MSVRAVEIAPVGNVLGLGVVFSFSRSITNSFDFLLPLWVNPLR